MAAPTPPHAAAAAPPSVAFIMPVHCGHLNPTLPLVKELRRRGCAVTYAVEAEMRRVVTAAGAAFEDAYAMLGPEVAAIGAPTVFESFVGHMMGGRGLGGDAFDWRNLIEVHNEWTLMCLGPVCDWLRANRPDVVVYDPCQSPIGTHFVRLACLAAGVPHVGFLSFAGPGSISRMWKKKRDDQQVSVEQLQAYYDACAANAAAVDAMTAPEPYGLPRSLFLKPSWVTSPSDIDHLSPVNIVTTLECLADPTTPEEDAALAAAGKALVWAGPLLDSAKGARRAGGYSPSAFVQSGDEEAQDSAAGAAPHRMRSGLEEDVPRKIIRAAKAAGRKVCLVSMGTVMVENYPNVGWSARPTDRDGNEYSITGKELCHAVYQGVFDALGDYAAGDEGTPRASASAPLVLVSAGRQPDAIEGLRVPGNAVCRARVPQVELLSMGVDLFVSHCGQNSTMEALAMGTPLVGCPGFGDQPANAARAASQGAALWVERPHGSGAEAIEAYRLAVKDAVEKVLAPDAPFAAAARVVAGQLSSAGGAAAAADAVYAAAGRVPPAPEEPSAVQGPESKGRSAKGKGRCEVM